MQCTVQNIEVHIFSQEETSPVLPLFYDGCIRNKKFLQVSIELNSQVKVINS